MNALFGLLNLLMLPIALLNFFGGVVAGIWLVILGEWSVIGWGIGFLVFSSFGMGIALMPGLALVAPAAYFGERGSNLPMYLFLFLHNLYTAAVITAWCGFVLYFFVNQATANSLFPVLLWSYGSATGPIAYMASKEEQGGEGGLGTVAITLFAQVGYVVMAGMVLLLPVTLIDLVIVFGAIMLLALLLQFVMAIALMRERSLQP